MRLVVQRVSSAAVHVDGEEVGAIGRGLLVLVGVAQGDDDAQVQWLADKLVHLRIFPDEKKAMNASVLDIQGELLVVSQFTLVAQVEKGRRPGFSNAADPGDAEALYNRFVAALSPHLPVATGRFGADMQVSLTNDGPVTFILER